MICSGIHREFTHRVKSVSMSKFTSQEVDALQNGGNQRARELFLKDWDLQRERLPNSSNVDKVREFIKAVYVDRKYAGGNKSEKPPRDVQSQTNIADNTRRASSYHSYSQSPPYDFQYEDRLKRKQGGSLMRKPGSDRGFFERKAASFAHSPGRFSDHIYEDRFASDGSSSRVSDYSVSSGGDPFRSGPQSPNLQKDVRLCCPTIDPSREIVNGVQRQTTSTYPEGYAKRDADRASVPRPQRTVSSGSFASFDSNSASLQSVGSGSSFEAFSEPNHSATSGQNKESTFFATAQSFTESSGGWNFSTNPLDMPAPNPAPSIDLFQAPSTGSVASIDPFQLSGDSSAMSQNLQTPQASLSSSSNNVTEISKRPSVPSLNQKLPEESEANNEGWATFDLPQQSVPATQDATISAVHTENVMSFTNMNSLLASNVGMQWPIFQSSTYQGTPPSMPDQWNEGLQNVYLPTNSPSNQPWLPFEESSELHHYVDGQHGIKLQVSVDNPASSTDQCLDLKTSESEIAHVAQKTANPFDIDSELEASNAFLDVSTLQAALPSTPLQSPYVGGINEPWFPSSPVTSQGGMSYMMAQASTSQLQNVPTHGPVASIGGNPFA